MQKHHMAPGLRQHLPQKLCQSKRRLSVQHYRLQQLSQQAAGYYVLPARQAQSKQVRQIDPVHLRQPVRRRLAP